MKIVSRYKDYYDSIAHMYGGGDPRVRYERDVYHTNFIEAKVPEDMFNVWNYYTPNDAVYEILVIGEKYLILYRDDYSDTSPKVLHKDSPIVSTYGKYNKKRLKSYFEYFESVPCSGGEQLVEMTRLVGNPIYSILNFEHIRWKQEKKIILRPEYTPLYLLGVQNFYPAEQIYQDLAYFIGNMMRPSPDVQPPGKPPQTDKEKILAHGMDLKYSFRHRH